MPFRIADRSVYATVDAGGVNEHLCLAGGKSRLGIERHLHKLVDLGVDVISGRAIGRKADRIWNADIGKQLGHGSPATW